MKFYLLNMVSWLESHQLPCLFRQVTHIDCPGCGFQRSLILLLQGNVVDSFIMYPALMPIMLLFAMLLLHLIVKIKNGANILKYMYFFCTAVIVVSYIYKVTATKTLYFG